MAKQGHRVGAGWPAVLVRLAAASVVCVALLLARVLYTGEPDYAFLVWNLALAWVPFALAVAVYGGVRHGFPRPALYSLAVLWLLFLPNAPYIVTDFVHLRGPSDAPRWFDALAIGAYAATGLLLGFASLYLMQAVAVNRLGRRLVWWFVFAVLSLTSIGIYLGRIHRLNSWDAVRHPTLIPQMMHERLFDPLENHMLLAVVIAFTAALTAAYLALYSFVIPRLRFGRRREGIAERAQHR